MFSTAAVKQVLDRKGYQVWSIAPALSVYQALAYMAEKNIGAVLVTEGDGIKGVFSERDYARKVALKGKNERDTLVNEVMTTRVIGVNLFNKIDECLALMNSKFIRHLTVVGDEGRVLGVVSIGDIVKELLGEQEFGIDQLVHYVSEAKPKPAIPDKIDACL